MPDELDAALAARTGPSEADLDTPEINAALDALGARIVAGETSAPPLRPRRRRGAVIAASAALAAALVVGAPAAADWLGLHTGEYGAPGMTENDTSEFLRLDSPEMVKLVKDLGKEYPLPPGGNWSRVLRQVGPDNVKEPAVTQLNGVRSMLVLESSCQWRGYWLDGYDRGDAAQKASAQRVLDEIPNWPVRRKFSDDDGEGDLRIAKAARLGDAVSVRYAHDMCTGKTMPDGPPPPMFAPGYLTDADRAGR